MPEKLTHNMQLRITESMKGVLDEKAELLKVKWHDVARMALARGLYHLESCLPDPDWDDVARMVLARVLSSQG